MGEAERRLNYPMSERTRFSVRVEINEDLSGTPRVEWVRHCLSLEEAQRGYVALRDRTGYGASQFGFGEVFDEAGQLVATVSYNGRLWAPSPDGRGTGWRPGADPVAEAPATDHTSELRGILSQLASLSNGAEGVDADEALRALGERAKRLLGNPHAGLTPSQSDPNAFGVRVWAGGPEGGGFRYGPAPEPDFIDKLADGDLVQGFSAQGDVLTEGVKTPNGVAWRRVHHAELDRARGDAADRIYEEAEFGGAVILDCSGWDLSGDTWVRNLFVEPEKEDRPSRRAICVLRFHPASDEAASLTLDGEEMLIPDQDPTYPTPQKDNPNGPDTGF